MNKVTLSVQGLPPYSFETYEEPHSEKDLMQFIGYQKWYWQVGLGAPVRAAVTVSKGFKKSTYSFEYTIKGNSMPHDEFLKVLEKYKSCSTCASMNVDAAQGIQQFVFLFDARDKAMQLSQEFDGICNIGSRGGYSQESKKYVVQMEYYIVT